jgi:tetratricopeptide (TPR) repeat protein
MRRIVDNQMLKLRAFTGLTWDMTVVTAANEPHYRAFISYSHADAAVATWLHRALESYHMPTNLVGRETAVGPVPRRLTPIFRDRDELAASGDLSTGLKDALAAAQFLIVIASPTAAKSVWVNEEVRAFKLVHGEGRVLTVIAAGEPGSADAECFPPAVAFRVGSDGVISGDRAEPIAADLRDHGDGKRLAKLKLIAGLTGLKLDDLVQREAARRQARMTWLAVAASLLALVMSGLTVVAVRARGEAEHQRAEADGLVEFMLTDLRKKLEPVGRLDALDVVGQRALKYYGEQKRGSLDADALGRRSRALHLVGEVRDLRGDSEGALTAFRQASATTGELLARDPNNGQRIFDHAQSVYWVGYIAYQRGQTKDAEAAFREYKRYADQLVALDPKNGDWQMEVSYAEGNLGTLLYDQGRYAEAEQAFIGALRVVEAAAARKPRDAAAKIEVGRSISWVATAQDRLNESAKALATLDREVAVYDDVLKLDPKNNVAKKGKVIALTTVGRLELASGNLPAARAAYSAANVICQQLLTLEPNNSAWRVSEIKAKVGLADVLRFSGQNVEVWPLFQASSASLDTLTRSDPKNVGWNIDLRSRLDMLQASQLAADHDFDAALRQAILADALLTKRVDAADPDFAAVLSSARLLAGDMNARLGRGDASVAAFRAAAHAVTGNDVDLRSPVLANRFVIFKRLGRPAEARRIQTILDQRSYRHPFYMGERFR